MYALAETHVVCVTTASPFLSCQVYIPSIKHISKRIYFHIDNLTCCNDGKKLRLNLIMRLICIKMFRLIACVNALMLTPLIYI